MNVVSALNVKWNGRRGSGGHRAPHPDPPGLGLPAPVIRPGGPQTQAVIIVKKKCGIVGVIVR